MTAAVDNFESTKNFPPSPPKAERAGESGKICGHQIANITANDAERETCEHDLRNLPLPHQLIWSQSFPSHANWFLAARDVDNRCGAGFALAVHKSRALPGHLLVRAERVGASIDAPTFAQLIDHLLASIRKQRVLRLNIELFSRDATHRAALAEIFQQRGFRKLPQMRNYANTIALDLTHGDDEIFASLHSTARRHIRAAAKNPVVLKPIDDPSLAPRLEQLMNETMSRTGGDYTQPDWRRVIDFSFKHPTKSRLIGLFRADATGPESLLAFAWSHHHGDHAHYDASASTRNTDLKLPLAYSLIWDLILWSKRNGAAWFDFGGITTTSQRNGDSDALAGISDFKRYFSKNVVNVAEEWQLEPRPLRASLARLVSFTIQRMKTRR